MFLIQITELLSITSLDSNFFLKHKKTDPVKFIDNKLLM